MKGDCALILIAAARFKARTVRTMELDVALYHAGDVMIFLPYSTSVQLNHRPVTVKGMKDSECLWPIKDMEAWLKAATGA